METINKINEIKENEVYQQILKDSFGGVLYNVANRNKYNTAEVLKLWNEMTPREQSSADGIMTGAINFITEKE